MTSPLITWERQAPIPERPYALCFQVDDDRAADGVVFLSEQQLDELLASGHKAQLLRRQAECDHDWVTYPRMFEGEPETRSCELCGAEEAVEADGSTVPIGGET